VSIASSVVPDAGGVVRQGPTLVFEGAAVSADGKRIASFTAFLDGKGLERRELHLWDAATRTSLGALVSDLGSPPSSMVFSPDGKVLFVGWENSPPSSYDVTKLVALKGYPLPKSISPNADYGVGSLAVSHDGVWLIARCATVDVCVWDVKTAAVRRWSLPAPKGGELDSGIASLTFAKGSTDVWVETDTGRVLAFDAVTLKSIVPPLGMIGVLGGVETGALLGDAGDGIGGLALAPATRVTEVSSTVTGGLPALAVQKIVRANETRLRACRPSAKIVGTLTVKFVIDLNGATKNVDVTGSIVDSTMRACVKGVFSSLAFASPAGAPAAVAVTHRYDDPS